MMISVDDSEAVGNARKDLDVVAKSLSASQRALELRKFFAPFDPLVSPEDLGDYNSHVNDDGALNAYAEIIVWRLRAARCMVSLVDRTTQYFLAGAARSSDGDSNINVDHDEMWFGCGTVETPGGLCEITLKCASQGDKYPYYFVPDLSKDARFSNLAVVNGELASYRFYAGTPITTELGVHIGTFFIFDDKPRPEGLTHSQRKDLYEVASRVMKHLETKREAAERRRVTLMSKGIADFLEKTSRVTENDVHSDLRIHNTVPSGRRPPKKSPEKGRAEDEYDKDDTPSHPEKHTSEKTLDKIKVTLDHAASILRDSLELTVGGVVFLDMAVGYKQREVTDAYLDYSTDLGAEFKDQEARIKGEDSRPINPTKSQRQNNEIKDEVRDHDVSPKESRAFGNHTIPAKVLAMSSAKTKQWEPSSNILDGKTLQTLINKYPQGNVWYLDDEGYFSSLDQANQVSEFQDRTNHRRRGSMSPQDVTRQQAEASLLVKVFEGARQIIFVPLWDAAGDRWHSGCFVWSRSAVPVFTVESEISYLSAFTNSVMVEINRLDAITANKMKSDFISSISHEFRSPLHGILASADFLRESELESTQVEFVATIQNCGSTLLDTINHVLDYSKINSFEKTGDKGTISNELYQISNLALLTEEIVNGMIAASEYQHTQYVGTPLRPGAATTISIDTTVDHPPKPLDVILDFEFRDWNYRIQPGALRRVIMNVFGNAQKYTASGFIIVQLRVRSETVEAKPAKPKQVLALNIIDSGRGMSTEYMERKLYTPFAQEDTFATGVGLGLSIVWSIIHQLGGKIQIRSQIGKGTDVEIIIPLEDDNDKLQNSLSGQDETASGKEADLNIGQMRRLAAGKTVAIYRDTQQQNHIDRSKALSWGCLQAYCSSWFGFEVLSSLEVDAETNVDLVIMEQKDKDLKGLDIPPVLWKEGNVLLIRDGLTRRKENYVSRNRKGLGTIWSPIGPYKLARSILSILEQDRVVEQKFIGSRPKDEAQPPSMIRSPESISNIKQSSLQAEIVSTTTLPDHEDIKFPTMTRKSARQEEITVDEMAKLSLAASSVDHIELATSANTPLEPIREAALRANPDSAQTQAQTSLRILAVDDNDLNLQLLSRYLRKRKYDTVVTATDGLEALNAVKRLHEETQGKEKFDLIFMDLSMPGMDGFESTLEIRKFEDGCQKTWSEDSEWIGTSCIVALTGLASRRDRDKAVECGVDDFMTKPVSFKNIGDLIQRICKVKEAGVGSSSDRK